MCHHAWFIHCWGWTSGFIYIFSSNLQFTLSDAPEDTLPSYYFTHSWANLCNLVAWMLGPWEVALLEGVALLEEVWPCQRKCVTGWAGFEVSMLRLHPVWNFSFLLAACGSRTLSSSPAPCLPRGCHVSCPLNWTSETISKIQLNALKRVALVQGFLYSNGNPKTVLFHLFIVIYISCVCKLYIFIFVSAMYLFKVLQFFLVIHIILTSFHIMKSSLKLSMW